MHVNADPPNNPCQSHHSVRRSVAAWLVGVLVAVAAAFASPAGWGPVASAQAMPTNLGPATWSDEFDASTLDRTKWNYRASGARNDGVLTSDAVSVNDGLLTIKTYSEAGRHYSGMISTQRQASSGFEQTYGYYEARVKFNDSPGEWSAFWLQSGDIGNPIGDPANAGVEMDVAEHRVRCVSAPPPTPPTTCAPGADVSDRVQQGLLWDGYANGRSAIKLSDALTGLSNASWHTYGLSWTPTALTFYYDDIPIWSMAGPISHHSQYLVLSSEVGAFFAGTIPPAGYGSRDGSTTNMQVDYVRVWGSSSSSSTTASGSPSTSAPLSTRAPVVSGTPKVGHALTCSSGSWTSDPSPTLRYQWLTDGSLLRRASTHTHVVRRNDRSHVVTCRVTANNAAGASNALSNALLIPSAPQRVRPIVVTTIACSHDACHAPAGRATAIGSVHVPRHGRARAHTYKLTTTAATSASGTSITIKLRLSHALRSAITNALKARKRIVVTIGARLLDGAGHTRTLTRHVPLRL
jgi:beta-glucanase (GH16 family)